MPPPRPLPPACREPRGPGPASFAGPGGCSRRRQPPALPAAPLYIARAPPLREPTGREGAAGGGWGGPARHRESCARERRRVTWAARPPRCCRRRRAEAEVAARARPGFTEAEMAALPPSGARGRDVTGRPEGPGGPRGLRGSSHRDRPRPAVPHRPSLTSKFACFRCSLRAHGHSTSQPCRELPEPCQLA